MGLSPTAAIRAYKYIVVSDFAHINVDKRTATHCRAHCHTLVQTAAHGRAHCRTQPHALPPTAALLHTAGQLYTAARTVTHCCSHCRKRAHCHTLPHYCCTLPHCRTTAHCHAHCHTVPLTLPHTAAMPQTAAPTDSCKIHIYSHIFTYFHVNSNKITSLLIHRFIDNSNINV
jgi:hypothetical protein